MLTPSSHVDMPQKRLLRILSEIEKQLPWVTRVGIYANAKSLKKKTLDEALAGRVALRPEYL
jgi:hypothetical protein